MGQVNAGLFSSNHGQWDTPQDLVEALRPLFPWDLDPAAGGPNICPTYYGLQADLSYRDGLQLPWHGLCWLNPPYGREIGAWVARARAHGCQWDHRARVVCLLPARTDTAWWQDNIRAASAVVFIRGRLSFGSDQWWQGYWQARAAEGKISPEQLQAYLQPPIKKQGAPFPSAFVTFGEFTRPQYKALSAWGWPAVLPWPLSNGLYKRLGVIHGQP